MGIKPLPEALQTARELELDLVEIAPMANPPVCKILDYPKYLYELKQKDKEARKKSIAISIKEMKYRPKIGGGDFDTKTRKVAEFLSEGHKVKITIMFRGREVAHPELGMRILNRVAEIIGPAAKIEATPRLDGRNMTMVLAPEKKAPLPKSKSARPDDSGGASSSIESTDTTGSPDTPLAPTVVLEPSASLDPPATVPEATPSPAAAV